jgi:hypothetical protein
MSSEIHQSMSVERFCRDLPKLHGDVIRNWGRIHITAGEPQDGQEKDECVLISRAELECLERALEIFCESPAGQAICKELEGIASRSTHRATHGEMAVAMADGAYRDDRPGL